MQMEPTIPLFREFFYLNRQTECADGPSLELDGVTIQRRRDGGFPAASLPSHPKGWTKTWFYCQNTTLADENPLPVTQPSAFLHALNFLVLLPRRNMINSPLCGQSLGP